ncbi:hypothetical protein E1263_32535 [Kribbella antibiotica]|uniref:Glycoside hydrolase family 42 N-terminal domain-containing protein n=1 Tax=Kribbella antibiotica TaxID=190195 RepID=A0A4R4YUT7_9ACTN|nr:hypothetical protein [Kribbella antibiotica]TDD49076.1 hypothetical protein E1263_32535 [Kribbella antibiotica]
MTPPTIARRGILQLAAAAGILPFLPATKALAQTTKAIAAPCSALPIISGPEFPIGAFWPPSMQENRFNTLEKFQEMKDAGFTFTFHGRENDDPGQVPFVHTSLDFTDQVGLKALVVASPENSLARRQEFTRHPSFIGFRLADEPSPDKFPRLATGSAKLREAAPNLLLNINLLPDFGGWRDYIHEFASTVQPHMLSYDRYPLFKDHDFTGYCAEWQEFRAAGLGLGVPTWIYILSVPHGPYRSPTAAELAWQVNVSLAYGCKGIQYFTYSTPDAREGGDYGPALIDVDGNRTPLYDAAKTLHASWLAPAGAELLPLVSERVVHANGSVPSSVQPFSPDAFLTGTSGNPVVLGTFRSKDRKPRTRWLLVANWSHSASAQATINVNTSTVTGISRFDPTTRTYTAQPTAAAITVSLAPGAAAFYRLDAAGASLDPQAQLVLASDSAVHHAIQQADDSWAGPNPLGGPARLVAASEFNGALNVMEMTGDVIYHRVRAVDGSWSARNLFGELRGVSSMTAAVVLGSLQVAFASGGVVYHVMQVPDGRWEGPNRLGDAANLVAGTELHGTFQLIQVEASGRIYHRVRRGNGTWSSRNLFVTMAGVTSVAVTVVGEEMMVVIAAGGQLHYAIQHTDGSWQWPTQTGDAADQVAASSVGGELQITAISGGQAYTRRRRADGTLTARAAVPGAPGNLTALASAGRSVEHCP